MNRLTKFQVPQTQEISRLAQQLLPSEERLCSMNVNPAIERIKKAIDLA